MEERGTSQNLFYEAEFDGSSKPDIQFSSVGGVIYNPAGDIICEYGREVPFTNNIYELEYLALIEIMKELHRLNVKNVIISGDSKWVIYKVYLGSSRLKLHEENLKRVHEKARNLFRDFDYCRLKWVSRDLNCYAHNLCNSVTQKEKDEQKSIM
jgi:ribonuclease HI